MSLEPSCVLVWGNRLDTTSLLRYFIPVSADQKLPDPQGALADMPSSAISAINMVVKVLHGLRTLGYREFPVLPEADLSNST